MFDVLAPERYASVLDTLGFARRHVRVQVYPHRLASTAEVVEWVRGTSLTRFEARLDADVHAAFVDRYRTRPLEVVGDRRPYLYTFKRILFLGAPGVSARRRALRFGVVEGRRATSDDAETEGGVTG